jgi:hypothetical protein
VSAAPADERAVLGLLGRVFHSLDARDAAVASDVEAVSVLFPTGLWLGDDAFSAFGRVARAEAHSHFFVYMTDIVDGIGRAWSVAIDDLQAYLEIPVLDSAIVTPSASAGILMTTDEFALFAGDRTAEYMLLSAFGMKEAMTNGFVARESERRADGYRADWVDHVVAVVR